MWKRKFLFWPRKWAGKTYWGRVETRKKRGKLHIRTRPQPFEMPQLSDEEIGRVREEAKRYFG